jgi:hypothetical protein
MLPDLANRALTAVVRVMGDREPFTFNHRGQTAVAQGVFQDAHVGLDPETGIQVRSAQPVLLLRRDDLPFRLQQGDEVEARGAFYKVRDAQPDGHTGVLVMLHRSPGVGVFVEGVFEPGVFAA